MTKNKKALSLLLIVIFLCQSAGFCASGLDSALRPPMQGSFVKENIQSQQMTSFRNRIKQLMQGHILHIFNGRVYSMYESLNSAKNELESPWRENEAINNWHKKSQSQLQGWFNSVESNLDFERLRTISEKIEKLISLTNSIIEEARGLFNSKAQKSIIDEIEAIITEDMRTLSGLAESMQILFSTNDMNRIIEIFYNRILPRPNKEHSKLTLCQEDLVFDKTIDEESLIIIGIIDNFIGNALRSSRYSSQVTIETSKEGRWAKIKVSDKGPGIPKEILPHIFEEGFTTKELEEGEKVGQGLYLTLEYLKLKGGKIQVDSKTESADAWKLTFDDKLETRQISPSDRTERGATFTVWLPLAPSQPKMETVGTENILESDNWFAGVWWQPLAFEYLYYAPEYIPVYYERLRQEAPEDTKVFKGDKQKIVLHATKRLLPGLIEPIKDMLLEYADRIHDSGAYKVLKTCELTTIHNEPFMLVTLGCKTPDRLASRLELESEEMKRVYEILLLVDPEKNIVISALMLCFQYEKNPEIIRSVRMT
ncbi:MAG: sensor histidine kinase [Candidatus Omnitrophota bacterium]|nr:sensor histidine kinase [Candidatus Omnitrophota bacterium]